MTDPINLRELREHAEKVQRNGTAVILTPGRGVDAYLALIDTAQAAQDLDEAWCQQLTDSGELFAALPPTLVKLRETLTHYE